VNILIKKFLNIIGGTKLKKLGALILVLALLFAVNSNSFAQPRLVIHVTGGYSVPLTGLAGSVEDLFASPPPTTVATEPKLYMKTGFNFGADVKFAFDKKRSIRGVLGLGYNLFMNSYDVPNSNPATTYKPQFNFFTASLGVEYAFLPKGKANPFIGVDFTGNFYSGKLKFDPQPTGTSEISFKTGARFGLQFGAGVDIALSKKIGIVVGGQYHLVNLIGKSDDTSGATATEIPLVDKERTVTVGTTSTTIKAIDLQALKLYAGVSFYLMQPKARMKK
jgi:opacity protein-like surface antigen